MAPLNSIAAATSTDVVRFAVHGQPGVGLVLKWTGPIGQREVADTLTGAEIRQMSISQNKLVVSGACESSSLAQDFILAGAKAYVSPKFEIPRAYLGLMFKTFYAALQSGATTEAALAQRTSRITLQLGLPTRNMPA
ncbi:MAG: CHAT domain-containing protein [Dechloromonas sp.]|nr:MAG: CHAT domain-containing protein [Dechloromonas sp.]